MLPEESIDVAFICDTYHHFEFPQKTMTSLRKALRPGGRVIVIDFRRIEGESSEWTLSHVRAGQDVFESEIQQAGFEKVEEVHGLLKENYMVTFSKSGSELLFPIVEGHGGVVAILDAVDRPRAGIRAVFDITADATKPEEVNKGLDRVARLLNMYGVEGLQPSDIRLTAVLHGEATRSVLSDEAWESRFQTGNNPNLPLIRLLQKAGVEVLVCGQALSYKGIPKSDVASEIPVATAALTVLLNRQSDGFAYVPVP